MPMFIFCIILVSYFIAAVDYWKKILCLAILRVEKIKLLMRAVKRLQLALFALTEKL